MRVSKLWPVLGMTMAVSACGVAGNSSNLASSGGGSKAEAPEEVVESAARAVCGAGSHVEPDLQGRVPIEDRQSGRSLLGYNCNLELKAQDQNQGASWQFAWYEDCGYYGTVFTGGNSPANPNMGVQVIDASDPSNPARTDALQTPAMLDPWESLKVNERRGLLGAVAGWNIAGPLYFDVYDVKQDCRYPVLKSSTPTIIAGHEGNWAPDGLTYYVGTGKGMVDVSNPELPVPIVSNDANGSGHGLSFTDDGNLMYAVQATGMGSATGAFCGPNGLTIFDTSQIQARKANPSIPVVGGVCWEDGSTAQHTIPIDYDGKKFVVFVDEGGKGAARLIDVQDPANPFVVSKLKLEIHLPDNDVQFQEDTASNGGFRYEGHYCGVDRQHNPTAVACGYFQSGVRVFDIRDPYRPKEIAYYNPPAQVAKRDQLKGSEHAHGLLSTVSPPDMTTDWCSAQVRFVRNPDRTGELWTTCQDSGFLVLRFTNGAWPLE